MPQTAKSKIEKLPPDISELERERWVAVLTSEGAEGWPGRCKVRQCERTSICDEGYCTAHYFAATPRRVHVL